MAGRYVWYKETEYVGGIPVTGLEPEWRPDEEPRCAHCSDYGAWIDEDGNEAECPDCGGEVDVVGSRVVTSEDDG